MSIQSLHSQAQSHTSQESQDVRPLHPTVWLVHVNEKYDYLYRGVPSIVDNPYNIQNVLKDSSTLNKPAMLPFYYAQQKGLNPQGQHFSQYFVQGV